MGISDAPQARDEYESYVPAVVELLAQGRPANEIADYLVQVETGMMGLQGDRQKAEKVAITLLAWQATLKRKLTN